MSARQFDAVRACFYLIAFVIGAQVFGVLIAEVACLYYVKDIVLGIGKCGEPGQLAELMTGALAAALAFAGGRMIPASSDDKSDK